MFSIFRLRNILGLVILTAALSSQIVAKDEWVLVKSKNFNLIGNATEKNIRKVGTKLEQFRETFRLIFTTANLTASIPTNVVVFKNESSFRPFKPKRSDGKIDTNIAGYFQAGEDVNYITLSVEGDDKDTFGTIFHEYVHFIINTNFGKSDVPQWFNEGLAEYYQTFEISDDIKAKLGLPQGGHLNLLQQNQLIPLDTFFNISNYQLTNSGGHSRSIFYAQSWALVHYLTQSGKSGDLDKFLSSVTKGVKAKTAFEDAFQTTYVKMEKDLKQYVSKGSFNYNEIKFKEKLIFDSEMFASPLSDAQSNAYLGDLLFHTNRPDDAEPFLVNALKTDPDLGMANTALGMVKIKQRNFNEARVYLEKAITNNPKNHVAFYRYAYLLSREGRDEFGYVNKFETPIAAKMRETLKKAIAIDPSYSESYELLAFVALVNNDELDEAIEFLQTALKFQPGNQRYLLRIAEIYSRQKRYDDAKRIADKIAISAEDTEMKSRADSLLDQIAQQIEIETRIEAQRKSYEAAVAASGGMPRLTKRIEGVAKPSEAEIAKLQELANMRSINDALRIPQSDEHRVFGRVDKIDCKKRPIIFTVKTKDEIFHITSNDFTALKLNALDPSATDLNVGCDAQISDFSVLVTYKPKSVPKSQSKGDLVALEFVPDNFRFLSDEEMENATLIIYDLPEVPRPRRSETSQSTQIESQEDFETRRREMILQSISDSIRKPASGENREFGYLEKIECTDKSAFYLMQTSTKLIKLLVSDTRPPLIVDYTSDLGSVRFGCGQKPIEFPVVFIYSLKPDKKSKAEGELISVEFVPKSFVFKP